MSQPDAPSLDALIATWRGQVDAPPDAVRVAADTGRRARALARRLALLTFAELLLTIGVLVVLVRSLPRGGAAAELWWTLTAVHTAIVWALVYWSRRPVWGPLTADSASFERMLLVRARRRAVQARWLRRLIILEAAAFAAWLGIAFSRGLGPLRAGGGGALVVPVLTLSGALVATIWYHRKAERERRWAEDAMRRDVAADAWAATA